MIFFQVFGGCFIVGFSIVVNFIDIKYHPPIVDEKIEKAV
jgi:hypothetical protein